MGILPGFGEVLRGTCLYARSGVSASRAELVLLSRQFLHLRLQLLEEILHEDEFAAAYPFGRSNSWNGGNRGGTRRQIALSGGYYCGKFIRRSRS